MLYFPIQALPEETQALVVERVEGNTFGDHYRLRATYISMKALSERRRVYHFSDVLNFPWGVSMPPNMLETCFEEGNFSTLYMRGVQLFYTFDLKDEGLAYIKRSADGGRDFLVRIGKAVRDQQWGWVAAALLTGIQIGFYGIFRRSRARTCATAAFVSRRPANPSLPNLPDEIMSKIIELVGEESSWYLGAFMRAGKRG
ncbi:hypothetical protein F2Q69_00036284 [Brassica cretica]|uniref:F-box domain-containing protein n=1 Tax=Brassica cretica TaxID=69181 RepID=A0A8S9SME8_BRACR|nr:hypothetical protein F2Q69_00036284 [Brassica cretica]